jgi:hypothetical protein
MSHGDWRSPSAYEDLRSLDAPGFAWEYLERNPDFIRERRNLERAARGGVLIPAEVEAFTRRWGVRFRGQCRSRPFRFSCLGGVCAAKRGRADEASG